MSGELWQDKPSIRCFCKSPLIRGNKRNTEQGGARNNGLPQDDVWIVCPDKILRSSVPKIQRNLKMTVFQEMVIESKLLNHSRYHSRYHSLQSAEDDLSNDIKIFITFSSQCTENPPFSFFWYTRYTTLDIGVWDLLIFLLFFFWGGWHTLVGLLVNWGRGA